MSQGRGFQTLILLALIFCDARRVWADKVVNESSVPQRIVALSPAITEMIYALGLQAKIVGVSEFSDYPAEAKTKPSVGPYTKPNLEKIYALHPDLVLIPQEGPADIKERLEQIHAPFKVVSMRKLDEIRLAAIEISKLLGNESAGEKFARQWREGMQKTFASKTLDKTRVLIEIQSDPLIVAGDETFLDEIVKGCGASNVISRTGYPQLSLETLVHEKVDLVLLADYFSKASEKKEALEHLKAMPSTARAAMVVLDPDFVARPGPRLLKGAELACDALRSRALRPETLAPAVDK